MRYSTLVPAALALIAQVSANPHASPSTGHDSAVATHHNDPRTLGLICDLLGGIIGIGQCGHNALSYSYPSKGWSCDGSGNDGFSYDNNKNPKPSQFPTGFLWFGASVGWGPPKQWNVPSPTWGLPPGFNYNLCGWWAPPPAPKWQCPPTISPPTWWPQPPGPPTPPTTVAPPPPPPTTTQKPTTTTTQAATSTPKPSNWAPPNFDCDGSGNDGYDYDSNGNDCPYDVPYSNGVWKWFGSWSGWQPEESWNVPSADWVPPQGWTDQQALLASWWSPGSFWHYDCSWNKNTALITQWQGLDPTWCTWCTSTPTSTSTSSAPTSTPTGNGWAPTGFDCDGSGNDGYLYDSKGNSCPYDVPYSNGVWKWFGSWSGWQPEESWNVPSADWVPPQGWTDQQALLASWWSPGSFWHYDCSWNKNTALSTQWQGLDPTWCTWCTSTPTSTSTSSAPTSTPTGNGWAPAGFDCDGSGNDGYLYDSKGNSCPYDVPYSNGVWKWFGSWSGWQPEESWNIPSADWVPPQGWTDQQALLASWWSPASSWKFPCAWDSNSALLSLWSGLDSTWFDYLGGKGCNAGSGGSGGSGGGSYPDPNWQCNGSGNDGWTIDHNGNSCPYTGLGWLWYGSNFGWLPAKGWQVPSNSWSCPSAAVPSIGKATWWCPSSSWQVPSSFPIPSFWISLGWSSSLLAPAAPRGASPGFVIRKVRDRRL